MTFTKSAEDPATGLHIKLLEEEKVRRFAVEEGGIIEHHLRDGVLHSFQDNPAVLVSDENDKLFKNPSGLYWYNNGVESREDGKPSMIWFSPLGGYSRIRRCFEGVQHCIGRASYEEYGPDGTPHISEFRQNGILFNPADAAIIKRDMYTNIESLKVWYMDPNLGKPHRDDGEAAFIERDGKTNKIVRKVWIDMGKLSRPGNKAPIELYNRQTGALEQELWNHPSFDKIVSNQYSLN